MIVSKYTGEGGRIYYSIELRAGASHNDTYTPQPNFQWWEERIYIVNKCVNFFHIILWEENVTIGADLNLLVSFYNSQTILNSVWYLLVDTQNFIKGHTYNDAKRWTLAMNFFLAKF